jgi:hypothetical protein
MANKTSRHLDFFSLCFHGKFLLITLHLGEISTGKSSATRKSTKMHATWTILRWSTKKINLNSVTLFSLATTNIGLARLCHSTYPSALVSACQMMNWPNKFLIWSSTSTLALSIGYGWFVTRSHAISHQGCWLLHGSLTLTVIKLQPRFKVCNISYLCALFHSYR